MRMTSAFLGLVLLVGYSGSVQGEPPSDSKDSKIEITLKLKIKIEAKGKAEAKKAKTPFRFLSSSREETPTCLTAR